MGKKSKTVELVLGPDGTYGEKRSNKAVTKQVGYAKRIGDTRILGRVAVENHADEFLSGIDSGLDLIEKFVPRLERFLRLRG